MGRCFFFLFESSRSLVNRRFLLLLYRGTAPLFTPTLPKEFVVVWDGVVGLLDPLTPLLIMSGLVTRTSISNAAQSVVWSSSSQYQTKRELTGHSFNTIEWSLTGGRVY